jgi:membrane protein
MGLVKALPPAAAFLLNAAPVVLGALGFAGLFYFVPNTRVRGATPSWAACSPASRSSWASAVLRLTCCRMPTYKTVYGAFAALPAFLLWVYFSWLVTLTAALVAATQPKVSAGRRLPAARGQRRAAG